jgi:galactokinase
MPEAAGRTRAFRAPGRVNLIGDHTDYEEGLVLPLALDLECVVRSRPRGDGIVCVRSEQADGAVELPADGSAEPQGGQGWGRYAAGVLRALAERGRPDAGMDATVSSTVPAGAGLSSSAALEVALALALCDAAAFELPPVELALACREAEQAATGVPCGIMDQLASVAGRRDCALFIDCRSLAVEPVPLPPELAVLAVDSRVARALADSAYAERREACAAAARRLGLRALRDATPEQVADDLRARHVVGENARVVEAAGALARGDGERLGGLLSASHASLRDDFEVSTPELDALARALQEAGALGARLTGAGFGGSVVAVAPAAEAERILEEAARSYETETGLRPLGRVCRAVDGAGMLDLGARRSE